MFGSTSIEVAIGAVFIFLMLSLLVTSLSELIASVLRSRSRLLWKGIEALLEDSTNRTPLRNFWAAKLYGHPVMRTLFPFEAQGLEATLGPKGKGPAYIPATTFSSVLLAITGVAEGQVHEMQEKLAARLAAIASAEPTQPAAETAAAVHAVLDAAAKEMGSLLDATQLKADLRDVVSDLMEVGPGDPAIAARLKLIAGRITGVTLGFVGPALLTLAEAPDLNDLQSLILSIPEGSVALARVRDGLVSLGLQNNAAPLASAQVFVAGIASRHARQALSALDNRDLREILLHHLDEARGDMEKFKLNVETWFDASMHRLSGWYKRRSQAVHVGIAAVLAVLMNVDTLAVVRHLASDPTLRQSLLVAAQAFPTSAASTTSAGLSVAAAPVATPLASGLTSSPNALALNPVAVPALFTGPGAAEPDATPTAPAQSTGAAVTAAANRDAVKSDAAMKQSFNDFRSMQAQLLALGLPIGWHPVPSVPAAASTPDEYNTLPTWSGLWCKADDERSHLVATVGFHLVGWLLTVVAASLGAPFWFDVLNKFMNFRSAGKAPATTKA